MPVKLFPQLCLLNSYIPITASSVMKSIPFSRPSRAIPILSRVFPHKLRYCPFRVALEQPMLEGQFGSRKFSARSGRGGVSRRRSGSGHEVRAQKSLIEDEADLSDWVSGLRSDSYLKTRVYSDSDDDDDVSGNESGGFGGKGSVGSGRRGRDERGGRKGIRESGFDDFRRSNTQDVGQDQMQPLSRKGGRSGSEGRLNRQNEGHDKMQPFSRKERRFGSEGRSDRRNEGRDKMQPFSMKEGRFGSEGRSNRRNEGHDKVNTFSRKGGRFEGEGRRGQKRGAEEIIASGYSKERRGSGGGGIARKGGREIRGKSLAVLSEDDDEDDEDVEDNGYKRFRDLIDSEEESEEGSGDDSFEKETVLSSVGNEVRSQPSPPSSLGGSDSYLSETRFDQFSLSHLSLKGIKDAGYEKMTLVQEATFPVILKGKDVLAKAKTGTGKTVAFLLPSIEIVLKSPPVTRDQKRPPILVLVVCPTRELASQAASEANTLLKYHSTIGVQVVIGGTRLALEQKRMQANPCQILVATPGRLKDHIENTAGFATRLMGVKVLVLDEADHLLDMGFRRDIERIIDAIPKQRQTLLFSATVPPEVRQICHVALKRDHEFINTVEEGSEETHSQVQQKYLVAPLDKQFSLLYSMLRDHIADDVNYKVLVFCTTAMVTRLVAGLLGELNLNVREIHSRKPQSYRTRVSDEFRKSKGLILVTSDVSARGVDYPDVTLVIQIGLPSDRQQYIHRLGRTGRKGKEGQGILLLAPWEEFFLSTIKDLPITKADVPLVDPETKTKVERALSHVEMKNKEAAYQAWLGYYNSNKTVGRDKCRLVELANEFSRSMGLDNPPAIPKLVIGKMGLKADSATDDERSRNLHELDRAALSRSLDETQQSWLLGPTEQKKKKYVDLGCIIVSRKVFKWIVGSIIAAALLAAFITMIVKLVPRHRPHNPPPDNYTLALHKALMFFNAQRSGKLPKHNNVSWRGNSGLQDGKSDSSTMFKDLVGGYYDAGDAIKFNFPQSFAMTMLSWSVIEYKAKYEATGELNHVKEIIKWGTDYLLKTFNSSADTIDRVVAQVGVGDTSGGSTTPNDHYCWMRPEDIDYPRPVTECHSCSDLAAEMAAALASASIVFKDNKAYSQKLVHGARTLFKFARDQRGRYSVGTEASIFYNSTGYWDEFIWGATWLYYATGNSSYLQLATTPGLAKHAGAFWGGKFYGVMNWDSKLAGAQVLLSRMRLFLSPGYPYEEILMTFHNQTSIVMCSYLPYFTSFNRTKGGLIQLNYGAPQPLQYVVNAAYLATLFADYLDAADTPGWYCGPNFYSIDVLRKFAATQIEYILGKNPRKMSYVVGFGNHYPKHVHHRGASIPKNKVKYNCKGGWKWRDSKQPNPNTIVGAMVAGPDHRDGFQDVRTNYNYTEPTLAGNAGLVAALVALSGAGGGGGRGAGIDKNTMFSAVPPMFPTPPPPPAPWKP